MPIQLEIFHPDRLVVGVARGAVTVQEYGQFLADMVTAGVIHYRKIIDVTSAEPTNMSFEGLRTFDAALRGNSKIKRGPLAIVTPRYGMGDGAKAFKAMTSADRPIEIFHSIHDARAWLQQFPIENP
jgi:hypothetical protein